MQKLIAYYYNAKRDMKAYVRCQKLEHKGYVDITQIAIHRREIEDFILPCCREQTVIVN